MIPGWKEWRDALCQRHGEKLQRKFETATVAVCELGGMGSAISIALARAGIGKLILIDFDRVDVTNLHRQQYKADQIGMYKTEAMKQNLLEIAPYLETETHAVRITESNAEDLLGAADIICEAFDSAEAKAMLVNGILEHFPEKKLVSATGMAGYGSSNTIITKRIMKNFYLCGDGVTAPTYGHGLMAPRVAICAAHEANMITRLILGEEEI